MVSSRVLARETEEKREITVALSAQGCCHGIQRKGEKKGLVRSKMLSWDTEERRDVRSVRRGVRSMNTAQCHLAHGIQGKREKNF